MEKLIDRIMQDGRSLPGGILKVDSFLNHQLDPNLMFDIAQEFKKRFSNINFNKIVTIEASGIAPAIMMGYILQLPVVFIKKKEPKTMEGILIYEVHNFNKKTKKKVLIINNIMKANDHVIFIDDFLAYGNAALGMIDLAKQAGATIEGMGFIIEKGFQGGGDKLREMGFNIQSLAIIDSLDDCKITLRK